jgi:hypothetical protein
MNSLRLLNEIHKLPDEGPTVWLSMCLEIVCTLATNALGLGKSRNCFVSREMYLDFQKYLLFSVKKKLHRYIIADSAPIPPNEKGQLDRLISASSKFVEINRQFLRICGHSLSKPQIRQMSSETEAINERIAIMKTLKKR